MKSLVATISTIIWLATPASAYELLSTEPPSFCVENPKSTEAFFGLFGHSDETFFESFICNIVFWQYKKKLISISTYSLPGFPIPSTIRYGRYKSKTNSLFVSSGLNFDIFNIEGNSMPFGPSRDFRIKYTAIDTGVCLFQTTSETILLSITQITRMNLCYLYYYGYLDSEVVFLDSGETESRSEFIDGRGILMEGVVEHNRFYFAIRLQTLTIPGTAFSDFDFGFVRYVFGFVF